jgi:hypothetical protein
MSDRSYNNSNAGTPAASSCPHNYPVSVTEPGFSSAMGLAKRTLAFAWYRYVEWLFLSAIVSTVLVVVLGLCVASYMYVHQYVAGAVLLGGMAALIFLVLPFTDRQSFLSHCGHIAVLTNLIMKGDAGNGSEKMFKYGRELATHKLGDFDTIWTVHRTIRSAARQLGRSLDFVDDVLPSSWGIDLSVIKRAVYRVLNWAMPYIDATVLSYGMARGDSDFGTVGLDGLVYAIQNAKSVIKTAIGAWFLEKLILGPLWFVSAVSLGLATTYGVLQFTGADIALLQSNAREFFGTYPIIALGSLAAGLVVGPLVAHLITKTLSEAFVRPMLIAMVLIKFHNAVRNQPIDTALQERIVGSSEGLANISDVATRLHAVV